MLKKIRVVFILVLAGLGLHAQSAKLDSLIAVFRAAKHDTAKIKASNLLCAEYIKLQQYDTVLIIAARNIEASTKHNYACGEADALFNTAMVYYAQDFQLESTDYFLKAVNKYQLLNNKKQLAKCFGNLGTLYYRQSLYPKSLDYQTRSLKLNTEIDNKPGIAICYLAMSNVYIELLKYDKAIEYAERSIDIRKTTSDRKGIATCYLSIGIVYAYQYKYDQALKYMNQSLLINRELGNKKGIAKALENIGIIYKEKKMYKQAIANYEEALAIFREEEQTHSAASTLIHIGNLNNELGQFDKGKKALLEAVRLSKEIGTLDLLGLSYQSLSQNAYLTKNFREAYDYHVEYKNVMDTIFNKENSQALSDIKTQYEVDKKETELKTQARIEKERLLVKAQEDKKQQNIIIAGVLGILMLVSVFSVFIFRGLQKNKKANRIITAQKTEVERQKHMVDEKQKEILDSITYAKRLQMAILPPAGFIESFIPDNFVLYMPKDIVAGDFYWMHVIKTGGRELIYIAAADSTGHGVPGAMVSIVCSNALDKAINDFELTDTGKILDKTRDLVLETFARSGEEIKDGMDVSLLCIDKANGDVTWSGANNQLWYLSPSLGLKEIKPDKQPIGKADHLKPFTTHAINAEKGTIFYLMTDGFADQFGGPKGKKYKYKQLEEVITTNSHKSLSEQRIALEESFKNWKGELEQVDDVTIIGIRV